jgi:hypothetical protein
MLRNVTESQKKRIAGRQRYTCAASVAQYTCPYKGDPFDEAGYEIDHIIELRDGGTNEDSNLQALCLPCHRVKTTRKTSMLSKKQPKPQIHKCYHCDKLNATVFENDRWRCKEDCIRECKGEPNDGCGSRSLPNPEVEQSIASQLFEKFRYVPKPEVPVKWVTTTRILPNGKVINTVTPRDPLRPLVPPPKRI